ncbi:hypothetical protein [Mycobacterium basiliense]|uniref:hypothetical protein n=1 Tax=Mycobacterium basiliense TaxID=2094119 RepID=UPI0013011F8A|nr:hypothetical protein [Mycobacterium basiliense]
MLFANSFAHRWRVSGTYLFGPGGRAHHLPEATMTSLGSPGAIALSDNEPAFQSG